MEDGLDFILNKKEIFQKLKQTELLKNELYLKPINFRNPEILNNSSLFKSIRAINAFETRTPSSSLISENLSKEIFSINDNQKNDIDLKNSISNGIVKISKDFSSGNLNESARKWVRSPIQILAHFHLVAAKNTIQEDLLGVPRSDFFEHENLFEYGNLIKKMDDMAGVVLSAFILFNFNQLNIFANFNQSINFFASKLNLVSCGFDPKGLISLESYFWKKRHIFYFEIKTKNILKSDDLVSWINFYLEALASSIKDSIKIST